AQPGPRTKVIILVHGNSVTHAFWDVRPDHSVARRLAEAGYLVIAYDRLGYGKSPYGRPHGAGYTLTISSQRAMLHEVVGQVQAGFNNQGFPPDAAVYVAGVWGRQAAAGKDYWILVPTPADCERVVLYPPGVVPSLLPQFCEQPSFVPGPAGEVAGIGRMYLENLSAIQRVGPGLPVLL